MTEKHIIGYLHERRLGVSSYDKPVPDAPIRLAPDDDVPGRFERLDGTPLPGAPSSADREDAVWYGCEETTASRIPPRRTKRSFRIRTADRVDNREIVAESNLEYGFYLIQRAEDRGRRIYDQPPARRYVLPDGRTSWHTFDFLVEETSGSVYAYAVRPEEAVDDELRTAVHCIGEQSLAGFADAAIIVTESFVTKSRVRNAIEILDARLNRNAADVEAAACLVRRIRGGVMLHDLVESLGIGPRGRVAVLCLVDDGVLDFVRRERLAATTLLRPAPLALAVA